MPSHQEESTAREARTWRPTPADAVDELVEVLFESSTAVVSSTSRIPCSWANEGVELARDLGHLAAPLLRREQEEVADELVGVAENLFEQRDLRTRIELGALEHRPELGHLLDGGDEVGQLLLRPLEPVCLFRCLEEGACVGSVRDRHATRPSQSPRALRSRGRRSPRRSAAGGPAGRAPCRCGGGARSRRSATLRERSSARRVSASTCLRVSSSRRCRSPSSSSRAARAGNRRSALRRISSPDRGLANHARCSSSRRVHRRGRSAS